MGKKRKNKTRRTHRPWQAHGIKENTVPNMPTLPTQPVVVKLLSFVLPKKLIVRARDNATQTNVELREQRIKFLEKYGD